MQLRIFDKVKTPHLTRGFLSIALITLIVCFNFQDAHAHGGVSMDIDSCKFKLGEHTLHYAGYKSTDTGPVEYCWDVPAAGITYITFDFINDSLRTKETGFQLFKKASPANQGQEKPIARIPFAKHHTGSMNLDVKLDKGHYLGVVSIREKGSVHHAKLNINVGFEKDKIPMPLLFLLIASFAIMIFYFLRHRKQIRKGS